MKSSSKFIPLWLGLAMGLSSCAPEVELASRTGDMGMHVQFEATPRVNIAPLTDPVLMPLPQCLGDLLHPTYRRDLPPQPEPADSADANTSGCEVENGVLHRYWSSEEGTAPFGPAVNLHGIGI